MYKENESFLKSSGANNEYPAIAASSFLCYTTT